MSECKWRFPGNGFTADSGLDTADMETFKKDSIASLARELCQNSIDAKRAGSSGPVRIEFESFSIPGEKVPGKERLEEEIDNCLLTWKFHSKIKKQLSVMSQEIQRPQISCLRISDFNTTGLVGVSNSDDKTPWHFLVHGSGISDKGPTSGGSKGIGKFATFVTSHFNTVFYSTLTEKGESGYEGICKLCSAKMPGTSEKTQGIGYFGSSEMNESIPGQLSLDGAFSRKTNEFGSDVYVIGFKKPEGWKSDIISKILDSFMSAIVFGTLVVKVDDIEINPDTLKSIVFNDELINSGSKKSVISQYLLLTDKEHRCEDTITIDGYGDAKLFLLEFDKEHEDLATNSVVMIRYPYMKIREINKVSTLPCSAMCVIGDNDLNKVLRNVENPQHTDWEFKRIEDESEKAEVKGVYNDLLSQIRTIIADHLASSDSTKTDLEGAGDFIPSADQPGNDKGAPKKIQDKPNIQKNKVKTKETNINASVPDENGDGVEIDTGVEGGDDIDTLTPSGHNKSGGGDVRPGDTPGKEGSDPEGNPVIKHAELRGMSYRFFCIDKKQREYGVTFVSDFDESEVDFQMFALDEGGNRYPVLIEECTINGASAKVNDSSTVRFSIKHGERYSIRMKTDQEELFSGEVKVYAYR